MKSVAILGATGSIGAQALDLLESRRDRFQVVLLTAHRSGRALAREARRFQVPAAALTHPEGVRAFREGDPPGETRLFQGKEAVEEALRTLRPDLVVHGIAGAAGLGPTLAALEAGADLALANKESLVMAGALVRARARERGCRILPVDSEHAAVFQCLKGEEGTRDVRRIFLTASGGALRDTPEEKLPAVTPAQVLRHPTWKMGPRVTVGSATMMNKAFEIVEAHWLFDLPAERIRVLIHRQSLVHAMVEFVDGSILAQMGVPDMRVPILAALGWPERLPSRLEPFDPVRFSELTFQVPDPGRYPALDLARKVLEMGGDSGAVLNAADEVGTAAFLEGRIPFPRIVALSRAVLEGHAPRDPASLEDVLETDGKAREQARRILEEW